MTLTLVVLAKSPRPGRVKTRLCPPCSPSDAAAIARAALADTLEVIAGVAASSHRLVLDGPPGPWVPPELTVVPQRPGDLAARLAGAIEDIDGAVLLVGMDTPQLRPSTVEHAVDRLFATGNDAVLGLATDGGWWAIGLRRAAAAVFAGIPTSRATTGARQLHRLHELGLRTELLDELRDVDRFDDALEVASAIPGSRFAAAVHDVSARIAAGSGARSA